MPTKVGNPIARIQDAPDFSGPPIRGFSAFNAGVFSTRLITPVDLPGSLPQYAAAGAGTNADKWVGWAGQSLADRTTSVPQGEYGSATEIDWHDQPHLQVRGDGVARLVYTGAGNIDVFLNVANTDQKYNCKLEGLYLDGGGKAKHLLELSEFPFSTVSNLKLGNSNYADGDDWAINGDNIVGSVFHNIHVHSDRGDDVYGLDSPTNGIAVQGSCNNLWYGINLDARTAALGAGFFEGIGVKHTTGGVAGASFGNVHICVGTTGYQTSFYFDDLCFDNTAIGCDTEYSSFLDNRARRTVLINTGGFESALKSSGPQLTIIGGHFSRATDVTNIVELSGPGNTMIGSGNGITNGDIVVTGTGDVLAINPIDTLGWGPQFWFMTATGKAVIGMFRAPQFWFANADDMHLAHDKPGGVFRIGNSADDNRADHAGEYTLNVGKGVKQFVLAYGSSVKVESSTPTVFLDALRGSNDAVIFGDDTSFAEYHVAVGKHHRFFVQGQPWFTMTVRDTHLNLEGNQIKAVADPTVPQDAMTLHYADVAYEPKFSLSGNLRFVGAALDLAENVAVTQLSFTSLVGTSDFDVDASGNAGAATLSITNTARSLSFINTGTSSILGSGTLALTSSGVTVSSSATPTYLQSFTTYPTTATRNDATYNIGWVFSLVKPISVTRLGRLFVAGNTHDHVLSIWDTTDSTRKAFATVSAASPSDTHGFKWATLATPFLPVAGRNYVLASNEDAAGDTWTDLWDVSASINAAYLNVIGQAYVTAHDAYPAVQGAGSNMYGTAAMEFADVSTPPYVMDFEGATQFGGSDCRMYRSGGRFVIEYNDSGTKRYKYLDMTGTGNTWTYSATAP